MLRFIRSGWFASLLAWIVALEAAAQDAPPAPPPIPKEPKGVAPRTVAEHGRAEAGITAAAVRQHKSGTWSVLTVTATNTQDAGLDTLVAAYFPEDSSRQFARRVWTPAGARRYTYLPVQIPPNIPNGVSRQALVTIALDPQSSGRETLQRRDGDQLTNESLLAISHDPARTATIMRRPTITGDQVGPEQDADAWETLMAARKAADLPEVANDIPGDFLPPWSQALEGFDVFLLTADRIAHDAAGIDALRGWIRNGGRLWITLDRVAPETVRTLLGSAADFTVIDRVELDRYEFAAGDGAESAAPEVCEYETPVELVRVATDLRDVPLRVNGWPAAIWIPFGQGEVLITTLAPRGWRPTEERTATAALRTLAGRLFASRPDRVDVQEFRSSVNQRIGYSIPPRSYGGAVLGGYFVSLIVGGVYFYRRRQAERLTWVVPIATLLAVALLAGAGAFNSTGIPPTIAYSQLVEVADEVDQTFVRGVAGIYDWQNRPVQWRAEHRAWTAPEAAGADETRRLVWTNDDAVETQNVTTRAGSVGLVFLEDAPPAAERIVVRARFGPEGLNGRLASPAGELSDPVIVGHAVSSLAVRLNADGSFTSRPDDALAAEQFSADTLLTDDQRRRQDVLRGLFRRGDANPFPGPPTFVAWRSPFDTSIRFPDEYVVNGEALLLIPLALERTPPGEAFRIPSTFLRPVSLAAGRGKSLAFNPKLGVWLENLTAPSESALGFPVPPQVTPCELTGGVLSVRLNAPSREFSVYSFDREGKKQLVRTIANPNGAFDLPLGPEHLALDAEGRVRLSLDVGPTEDQKTPDLKSTKSRTPSAPPSSSTNISTWQIEYVRLTVDGRVRSRESQP